MKKRTCIWPLLTVLLFITSNAVGGGLTDEPTGPSAEVLSVSEVNWEKLNPARGDKSPQAGTLWGDRSGMVPTGFLVKFVDGFSSPPHIHNVTYRGVVISGLVHNDDPDATEMWMPAGSFWTQPKGEVHITAAQGSENVAYIEIDAGPYFVMPTEEAFTTRERPVNVDPSNIVWVDLSDASSTANGVRIAYLWGKLEKDHLRGTLIRLPAGFNGRFQSEASVFRAVVISGAVNYRTADTDESIALEPGSYFGSDGTSAHAVQTAPEEESIIYIRSNGPFRL